MPVGVFSFTVILKEHVAILPDASVALKPVLKVPMPNARPDCMPANCVMVGEAVQLSEAVALKLRTLRHSPEPRLTTILLGQVMIGAILSSIVTAAEQVAELPEASVAVKMTVFEPKLEQSKAVLDKERRVMPQLSVELLSI